MTDRPCTVCGGPLSQWFERLGRAVYRCGLCGHIQVPAGVMHSSDGVSIYEEEHAEIFEGEGTADYYLDDSAADAARAKIAFVRRYAWRGTLLDIGASYGHFLAAASPGFDAYGIELNPSAVSWSREHLAVRNCVGSVYEIPDAIPRPLAVMTAWDVIEHLDDPRAALMECRRHLVPGGWLFVSTPDASSLSARLMGTRWHYQDPVQHINLFSQENLGRLLRESGFSLAGQTFFGRRYRINYVLRRLSYLMGGHAAHHVIDALLKLPARIREAHVTIKLRDVVGIAAQAV